MIVWIRLENRFVKLSFLLRLRGSQYKDPVGEGRGLVVGCCRQWLVLMVVVIVKDRKRQDGTAWKKIA